MATWVIIGVYYEKPAESMDPVGGLGDRANRSLQGSDRVYKSFALENKNKQLQ
jgi:hypothetical protein